MAKGMFIAFDGGEGCGKSTQTRLLAEYLTNQGRDVLLTYEPGDYDFGKYLRRILLNEKIELDERSELFMFELDRAGHCQTVIIPALETGQIVISDRFSASTYAYQVYTHGICSKGEFQIIDDFATGGLKPNIYIYIDLDPSIGFSRKSEELDRIESRSSEYHQKIRQGFKDFFDSYKGDQLKIDGTLPIEKIQAIIRQTTREYL